MDEGAVRRIISLIARNRLCLGCIAENAELLPDHVARLIDSVSESVQLNAQAGRCDDCGRPRLTYRARNIPSDSFGDLP
jgi:hypothetical protein